MDNGHKRANARAFDINSVSVYTHRLPNVRKKCVRWTWDILRVAILYANELYFLN